MRPHRRDRGSASIWVLAIGLVVVLIGMTGVAVGQATVARHRAGAAADLAALAGAVHAAEGAAVACGHAGRVAAANRGRITSCVAAGLEVTVAVEVRPVGLPGVATARARAGPAPPDQSRGVP